MPIYKILIEYDGTKLHGWQSQPNVDSVQSLIEDALSVLSKHPVTVVGSGRTDAGVHARGQVAHFRLESPIEVLRLQASLNGLLPDSVRVLDVADAPDSFHARYDAILRTYHYYVSTQPRALDANLRWHVRPVPDFDAMNDAAALIVGERDFSSFCRNSSETKNRVCRVVEALWRPEDREGDWQFSISANRFLHGMVRAIVGTIVEIGHGKRSVNEIPAILEARDRRMAGQASPAHGLVLERVTYPDTNV